MWWKIELKASELRFKFQEDSRLNLGNSMLYPNQIETGFEKKNFGASLAPATIFPPRSDDQTNNVSNLRLFECKLISWNK